jgi:biopolymer transport protein ExbD
MITRPLDLASKLRPEPRNFDFLFLVNGGLIVLFFVLFGSRFVLAPGLGVDFQLPEIAGSVPGRQATDYISVERDGLILVPDKGRVNLSQLSDWLKERARLNQSPTLLVRADRGVPNALLMDISMAANKSGFKVFWAVEAAPVPVSSQRVPR